MARGREFQRVGAARAKALSVYNLIPCYFKTLTLLSVDTKLCPQLSYFSPSRTNSVPITGAQRFCEVA